MTYLVIGAGPAGLAAIKSLKQAGLPVEAVEKHAGLGGQWLYGAGNSAVYASAHLISSKRTTAFADFPMPDDRSEEHTSELQLTSRNSDAGFRLNKNKQQ